MIFPLETAKQLLVKRITLLSGAGPFCLCLAISSSVFVLLSSRCEYNALHPQRIIPSAEVLRIQERYFARTTIFTS